MKLYVFENEKWGFVGVGKTEKEAIYDFGSSIADAYYFYADEIDSNLTPDAIQLKRYLIDLFGKVKNEEV